MSLAIHIMLESR